jgi:hypothetical protein
MLSISTVILVVGALSLFIFGAIEKKVDGSGIFPLSGVAVIFIGGLIVAQTARTYGEIGGAVQELPELTEDASLIQES